MLVAARHQARGGFEKGASLDASSEEAKTAIQHAEGVCEILLKNLVQGQQMEGSDDRYKLNIHEHTERGDNDTIKNPRVPGGKVKIGAGGCG